MMIFPLHTWSIACAATPTSDLLAHAYGVLHVILAGGTVSTIGFVENVFEFNDAGEDLFIAQAAGNYLQIKRLELTNSNVVDHTVVFYRDDGGGAAEITSILVPASGTAYMDAVGTWHTEP